MVLFGDGIADKVLCWEGEFYNRRGGGVIHTCPKPNPGEASDLTCEGFFFNWGGVLKHTRGLSSPAEPTNEIPSRCELLCRGSLISAEWNETIND